MQERQRNFGQQFCRHLGPTFSQRFCVRPEALGASL